MGELKQWHRVEVRFSGPLHAELDDSPNPFLDYRLQCSFTGPSGRSYEIPGFFDSDAGGAQAGSIWGCRFSPDELGAWQYTASFRQGPEVAVSLDPNAGVPVAFDGESGTFVVGVSDKTAPDFRAPDRGTLVNLGGHYLQFRGSGRPWVKGGVNIPENLLGYTGFDNTPSGRHTFAAHLTDWRLGDPDWGAGAGRAIVGALNYLAATGANSVYFLPMNVGGDGNDTFPTLTAQGKTHYDTSKLLQWETVFTHADRLGIFLHFQLSEAESANAAYHDGGTLGRERKLFYRELIARFGHHLGIEWDIGEENNYDTLLRTEFAAYIRALDAYSHPMTTHTRYGAMEEYYAPLLGNGDFTMTAFQYGLSNLGPTVESWRQRSAAAGRPWVISMDEPHPIQNDLLDDATGYPSGRRNFLWPVYLSGGGGFEWYVKENGGGDTFDLRIEDFREMEAALLWTRHARAFLDTLPLLEMAPARDLGCSGCSTLAKPGAVYALYRKSSAAFSVDLSASPAEFLVTWFDPRAGSWHDGGTVTGGGWRSLGLAPFGDDAAVLVLRADLADGCTGAASCEDANPCTDDACDPTVGCVHVANTAACDDAIACTTGDRCSGGTCSGVDACATGQTCNVVSGVCETPVSDPRVWLAAATEPTAIYRGAMTAGAQFALGDDADPAADALIGTLVYPASTLNSFGGGSGDEVAYSVTLPHEGVWYLWARLYYPGAPGSNDANSFFVSVDGAAGAKLGNNLDLFQVWHWGGDGSVERGPISPLSLGSLTAGVHELTIEKREVTPIAPRLDVLVLTPDASVAPTDDEAIIALGLAGQGSTTTVTQPRCATDLECDNGLFCDGAEICDLVAGCQPGIPPDCRDTIGCTADACNETLDRCEHAPADLRCNDGLYCNGIETCDALLDCRPGTPPDCNDAVPCTVDACNELVDGCKHTPDHTSCQNGDACDGVETCDPTGACLAGVPPSCDDGNVCTHDTCIAATGCSYSALMDGPPCDDGDVCNGTDTCRAGLCVPGVPLACDDGVFCNGTEACDPQLGCQAGTPPCNDQVACTVDVCNEATDGCMHALDDLACQDGSFCNGAESCDAVLGCRPGTAPDCSDGVGCTVDSCDELDDGCDHSPDDAPCDDGLFCNGIESCNPVLDCQAGVAPECNDGVSCTVDTCNDAAGGCGHVADHGLCDDGNPANGTETCNAALDCQPGTPNLSVSISAPATVDKGKAFSATATVSNTGAPAAGLSAGIDWSPTARLRLRGSTQIRDLPVLEAGGQAVVSWNMRAENEGDAILTVTVTDGQGSLSVSETVNLTVED